MTSSTHSKARFGFILTLFNFLFIYTSQGQAIDDTFTPNIEIFSRDMVGDFVIQPDDKIIISGSFYMIEGAYCYRLARINNNGSLDPTFNPGSTLNMDDGVANIILQPDGKLIVTGRFRRSTPSGVKSKGLFRFNSDGTLDTSFQPVLPNSWNVTFAALQPDGKIVIGWTAEIPNTDWMHRVARLNADGSIDNTFNCNLDVKNTISAIAIQPDGKIVVAGTSINYETDQSLLKRFNSDGSEETSFNPVVKGYVNTSVNQVSILLNGDLLISGMFTTVNGSSRIGSAMLQSDGQVKADIYGIFTNEVSTARHLPLGNDRFLLSTYFSKDVNGTKEYHNVIVLNQDGSVESDLLSGFTRGLGTDNLFYTARDSNGNLYLNGSWSSIDGVITPSLVRLTDTFSVDLSFKLRLGDENQSMVAAVEVVENGKVVIGGVFNYIDNVYRNNLAKLNFNGTLDASFDPGTGPNGIVYIIRRLPDGKILVAGDFDYFNQQKHKNIVRLNSDGSIDPGFQAYEFNHEFIYALDVAPDDKIVVKGNVKGTYHHAQVVRLNVDGSLDQSFQAETFMGLNNLEVPGSNLRLLYLAPLAVQPDGKIITEDRRYNLDGTRDNTFQPVAKSIFVALEPSGTILMRGGSFLGGYGNRIEGFFRADANGSLNHVLGDVTVQRDKISAFYIQPNKKFLYSRERTDYWTNGYPTTRRLHEDGSIDNTYSDPNTPPIHFERLAIKKQATDLLLVAGLAQYSPYPTYKGSLVRIKANTLTSQSITFNPISDKTFTEGLTVELSAAATSGLPVSYQVVSGAAIINGTILTVTGTGTISVKAFQPGNENIYPANDVIRNFSVKRIQIVDFPPIENQVFEEAEISVALQAISSSGLAVVYQVVSGNAIIAGSTVTVKAPGQIVVKAVQAGDANFYGSEASQAFYAQKNQAINFSMDEQIVVNAFPHSMALQATANSGLPVSFEVVEGPGIISGSTLTISTYGPITVRTLQSGSSEYLPAASVDQSSYAKQHQTIEFETISNQLFSNDPTNIPLSVFASSGLPVVLEITYGNALLTNTTLTVQSEGRVTLHASQSGNNEFVEAEEVIRTFCLNPVRPVVELQGDMLVSSHAVNNQWYLDGVEIVGATDQAIEWTSAGGYTVRVSADDCISEPSLSVVITGVENPRAQILSAFPNPANDYLRIELNNISTVGYLKIFSSTGEKILDQAVMPIDGKINEQVILKGMPRGMYIVTLTVSNKTYSQRIKH